MTTATTPRQPAKRAKGRAYKIEGSFTPREYKTRYIIEADEYDQAVERMARAGHKAAGNGAWKSEMPEVKELFYDITRAALKSIGIAAPRKERKQP